MASMMQFSTRDITNLKTEAEWLADTTYFILPNESVEAYTTKTVQVDGTDSEMVVVRSKTNTTNTKKLFKELTYNDEYVMYSIQNTVNEELTSINTTITKLEGDLSSVDGTLGTMKMDLTQIQEDITTNQTGIADNKKAIESINATLGGGEGSEGTSIVDKITELENTIKGDGTETNTGLADKVTKNTTDITGLTTRLTKAEGDISAVDGSVATINTEISAINSSIDTNTQNITSLQGSVSTINTTLGTKANVSDLDDFVTKTTADSTYSKINSPTFTGEPKSTTPTAGDATTRIATTKFVMDAVGNVDTSALQTQVTKNANDIKALDTNVTDLSGTVSSVVADMQNKLTSSDLSGYLTTSAASSTYMPKSGGTFTGAIKAPTGASTLNDTTVATTAWVRTYVSANGGGSKVTLSSTAPSGAKSGDLWLKTL